MKNSDITNVHVNKKRIIFKYIDLKSCKLLKKCVRIHRIPFSPLTTVLSDSSEFANLWKLRRETMPLWMEASFDFLPPLSLLRPIPHSLSRSPSSLVVSLYLRDGRWKLDP